MPGILPMKVIKVGSSSQARIAQACDRCRSKKIKCDGIRPCCSQCQNVGFECKTSDKLSRRAFPRGYTESLEERVRVLEAEVRELKGLLDAKEEKIDMLAKMHSNRRPSHSSMSSTPSSGSREESSPPREDTFKVQASPLLLGTGQADLYFMGASSGRAFVDALKRKIQETGKSCSAFNTEAFLNRQVDSSTDQVKKLPVEDCIPPRLFSDKYVQIFWQEWAPLFPVLNKSSFLRLYEEYVAEPEKLTDNHKLAQLHLVFGISALSCDHRDEQQIKLCESQWWTSLEPILMDNTLATLQCLVLAALYSLLKGDYKRLQQYKGIGVALSHRLGLHQSQKRFSFGALTLETRKKVFWTLYSIDCFSAAAIGLPALLKDEDIHCEYPTNIDDEYITEKGFLPTLPGESSKISCALALFQASRILSKVLVRNYPAATSHELSLQSLSALESELDDWSNNLPSHLKLSFVQDKPSTDITGDRSPLLSLAYYYIRTLIHRPALGSTLGSKASSSVISVAESSKHIIQIVQLLDERSMSFSFCLNKNEILTLCGLSLLYQGLDLKQEGQLIKDGQRLVSFVVQCLENANAPGALDFRRLAASMITFDNALSSYPHSADNNKMLASTSPSTSSPLQRKQPMALSSRYPSMAGSDGNSHLQHQKDAFGRTSAPTLTYRHSSLSLNSTRPDSSMSRRDYTGSHTSSPSGLSRHNSHSSPKSRLNLDYLPLNSPPANSQQQYSVSLRTSNSQRPQTHAPIFTMHPGSRPASTSSVSQHKLPSNAPVEWDPAIGALDSGDSNIYDAIYGGPSLSLSSNIDDSLFHILGSSNSNAHANSHSNGAPLSNPSVSPNSALSHSSSNAFSDWSSETWGTGLGIQDLQDFDMGSGGLAQSVLSFSEDGLSSSDDMEGFGPTANNGSGRQSFDEMYRNAPIANNDGYLLDGLDGGFTF